MKLSNALKNYFVVNGNAEKEISGVVYDSRNVRSGFLFVAIKGENFDGHIFIEDAIRNGAVAVVYESGLQNAELENLRRSYKDITWIGVQDSRDALAAVSNMFYEEPSLKITIVGITGTNGKTTTSYLVKSIIEKTGVSAGLIGTINYMIKDISYDAPHTTPESPDFQALVKKMSDSGCGYLVTEVSSHALAQKRVDYTRFAAAVFTNLTQDHLDFHKTMENYFIAKSRLFTELLSSNGCAVINIDDPYGMRLVDMLKAQQDSKGNNKRIYTFAIKNQDADLTASDIKTTFNGTRLKIKFADWKSGQIIHDEISSPLLGEMNAYNILSAICVSLSLDLPLEAIKEGIASTGLVRGRFEKIDMGQKFLAVVDYAHTEDALERLLTTAGQLISKKGGKKIITVFGCGGNRDKGKRPKMGKIASNMSGLVIITSDNPRNEDPRQIIRDIERGIEGDNYVIIPDRSLAISMAVRMASAGDVVVVAGKGHEDYQEIKGVRQAFDDKKTLEEAIRQKISRYPSNRAVRSIEPNKDKGAIAC